MASKIKTELDKAQAQLVDCTNRLLDEIEQSVLPSDPEEAIELLTKFILHDIFGGHDWLPASSASQRLARAMDLAVIAAQTAPPLQRPKRETIN